MFEPKDETSVIVNVRSVQSVTTEDHFIDSDTQDIRLRVRQKRHDSVPVFGERKTILMMHGASFSSGSLFDVRVEGFSFMDYLALKGYDVFAVDARGYGDSTRPVEMDQLPSENAPLVRTEIGVRDFSSAVDFVLRYRNLKNLNVIGMSWGGSVAGAYTSRNPDKVHKLGLIAPQWLNNKRSRMDSGGELGAYRTINVMAVKERWIGAAPEHKRASFLPEGWFEQWAQTTIATEAVEDVRREKAIRATNGAVLDTREYWSAGKAFYQPSEIAVPVLLVHGEWDWDVDIDQTQAYFLALTGTPYKRWVEIGEATHMMVLERNRVLAYEALTQFFAEEVVARQD